ncbi:MAG: hypothetical protein SGJ18_03195 [Pseudomonadota bacterium]|nr:hypothetical protein [Pseudomonadota bacterium]
MAQKKNQKSKKSGDMLVISSKIKAKLKKSGCNTAGDALKGLNDFVYWLLDQAATRAKVNGRKTVRKHDFMA